MAQQWESVHPLSIRKSYFPHFIFRSVSFSQNGPELQESLNIGKNWYGQMGVKALPQGVALAYPRRVYSCKISKSALLR